MKVLAAPVVTVPSVSTLSAMISPGYDGLGFDREPLQRYMRMSRFRLIIIGLNIEFSSHIV
jgi:hypothetical protein